MNKQDLALNNQPGLICSKTQETNLFSRGNHLKYWLRVKVAMNEGKDCLLRDSLGKGMNPIILPPAMGK